MSTDSNSESITLKDIGKKLKVRFPGTVGCKIDALNREARIGRIELFLES